MPERFGATNHVILESETQRFGPSATSINEPVSWTIPSMFEPEENAFPIINPDTQLNRSTFESEDRKEAQHHHNHAHHSNSHHHHQQQQHQGQQPHYPHQHHHQQHLPLKLRFKPRYHRTPSSSLLRVKKRTRRFISMTAEANQWLQEPEILYIETAIFVDSDLFRHMAKNFPRDTGSHLIRVVLAMINGVQLLYHHPSLGRRVNFVLKRLEILEKDPPDLRRSSDIDIYLSNFCKWQNSWNPSKDSDPFHYDHAVILTGKSN